MKIKLVNLIEGGVNTPTSTQPFNPKQPFGQPVIPSVPKSSGVYSQTPTPPTGIAAPKTGTGSFILDNPPTPQTSVSSGGVPPMLTPNFNPGQPFGQSVIPSLPPTTPGTEYSPTPGSVKPKNPTVVQVPSTTPNKVNEPGMSQEDLERDADKWAEKQPEQNIKPTAPQQPQQKDTRSEHEKFMKRTSEKLERDRLRRQTEIEAETHNARLSRIQRSRTRIFEQQKIQLFSQLRRGRLLYLHLLEKVLNLNLLILIFKIFV